MKLKSSALNDDALGRRLVVLSQFALCCGPLLALFWSLQLLFWRATFLLGHAPQFPNDDPLFIGQNDATYLGLLKLTDALVMLNFFSGALCLILAAFFGWANRSSAKTGVAFPLVFVALWCWLAFGPSHLDWFFFH